jgi:hypothetical protein
MFVCCGHSYTVNFQTTVARRGAVTDVTDSRPPPARPTSCYGRMQLGFNVRSCIEDESMKLCDDTNNAFGLIFIVIWKKLGWDLKRISMDENRRGLKVRD